jgi:hypothetical protein
LRFYPEIAHFVSNPDRVMGRSPLWYGIFVIVVIPFGIVSGFVVVVIPFGMVFSFVVVGMVFGFVLSCYEKDMLRVKLWHCI